VKAIQWRSRALRELNSLDKVVARRVVVALERYAATGHGDVIRLQDSGGKSRLRVGDWRILFENLQDGQIRVLRVLHRSQAYR
jgi:mRNA-degrading endonuclease RelE of RelBE toxin-antitoxin system